MSKIAEVLKNRNRVERLKKERHNEEVRNLRLNSAFRARLHEELKTIDVLLSSDEVEYIEINVPNEFLPQFGEAIYSEDLAEYDVKQVDGEPNKFLIGHKYI